MLTVFTGEPVPPRQGAWDALCGFVDSTAAAAVRRSEDDAAFADSPHRPAELGLVDGQYSSGSRTPTEAASIGGAVADWAAQHPDGTVALPAGAGARTGFAFWRHEPMQGRAGPAPHPDHVFIRDAAVETLAGLGQTAAALYEELPYLAGGKADAEARRVAAYLGDCVELRLPVDRAAKAARIGCYASQVPHLTFRGRSVARAADLPSYERYWVYGPRLRAVAAHSHATMPSGNGESFSAPVSVIRKLSSKRSPPPSGQ